MFSTSYIAAYYLKHVLQFTGKVYLMGMLGLHMNWNLWACPTLGRGWVSDSYVGEDGYFSVLLLVSLAVAQSYQTFLARS